MADRYCTECGKKMLVESYIYEYSPDTGKPVYAWKKTCPVKDAFNRLPWYKKMFVGNKIYRHDEYPR